MAPTFLTSTFSAFQDDVCLDLVEGDELILALAEVLPVGRVSLGPEPRKVRFPRGLTDVPLPQADRATQEACLAQCEELFRSRAARLGPAARVRTLLLSDTVAPPTFEAVAASLLTHPRTPRRQLVAEGTSYLDLLNEVRSELAMELISQVGLSVEQTSRRLGYADMASFTHAFTRWYGQPPSRFHQRHWHRSVNGG